jgi:predicted ATPase
MKNHLTLLGLSFALCTFIVAQASTSYRSAPAKSTHSYSVDQQDTSKKKMHKKWKKDKDTTGRRETDTSALRTENR